MMKKIKLAELHQKRDADLIEKFCTKEALMGDHAQPVRVCRMIPFEELLTILHQHDARELEALKEDGAIRD